MDMLTWLTGLEIVEVMADMATFFLSASGPYRQSKRLEARLQLSC